MVEKILSFSSGLYVSSTRSSWFTGDKQGTLILFFCVVKPLCEQFFDWNCCVDTGSEGKIWKSVQNSLLTGFFTGKMKINCLETWNIPFSWQQVDIFRSFLGPWGDWKQGTCVFKKITKICYILGKNKQEISALEANINSFQRISVKYLPFPHPDNSLMTWSRFGLHHFNIGNAKNSGKIAGKVD